MADETSQASPVDPTLAGWLAAAGFGVVMLFLALVPWFVTNDLPNFSKVAGAVVTGLLGAVMNPNKSVKGPAWVLIVLLAIGAIASTGLAVLVHPAYAMGLPSFAAAGAAFTGLFVDTSNFTHPAAK